MYAHYLFVYGTLMRAFDNYYASYLREASHFVGEGLMEGHVYLIEEDFAYPAATYEPGIGHTVKGEIYYLPRPDLMLRKLDVYEGIDYNRQGPQPYARKEVEVRSKGDRYHCTAYIYRWPTAHLPVIRSGSFLDATKKGH